MSNTGFGHILSPARPAAQQSGTNVGQIVKIISLPKALGNPAKAIRIAGEVTQKNENGTLRISTDKGEVEVQVKGNKIPEKGQKLEIEIPTGRPPRQATLRDAPQQQAKETDQRPQTSRGTRGRVTTQRSPTPQQQTQSPSIQRNTADAPRQISPRVFPPLLHEGRSPVPQQSTATAQARPLTAEATVRLISSSPAQAQAIAAEYLQTLTTAQPTTALRVAFTANLIVQNAQSQQEALIVQVQNGEQPTLNKGISLLQKGQSLSLKPLALFSTPLTAPTITPTPPSTLLTPTTISAPPTTALNLAVPTPASAIQTTFLPLAQNAQTVTSEQIQSSNANPLLSSQPSMQSQGTQNIAAPTITTPSNATLTPLTFDPANPIVLLNTGRIGQIDIQVLKITPPPITLTPTGNVAKITSPLPAATQFIPALTSVNNAVTLTAKVTGFTPQGLPLVTVRWPGSALPQSFVLQFNSNNLQLGSQLQIIPKGAALNTAALPSLTGALPPSVINPLLMGFQWPALDELYNNLLHISPQAAASLARALPNAASPAQIGPAAMMFIAAVRSGDISGWLGDKKIDLLQRSNPSDILKRLSQDSPTAGRAAPTAETAQTSEWRAAPLPMFWEGEIHKITLFTRHENQGHDNDEENENKQTRFVFDLSLSRMGDIQLDGLLRDKRLDLVIRAQNTFSETMQQTMRKAYTGALSSTELTGDLNFQGSTKNWVHVLQEKEQLGVEA